MPATRKTIVSTLVIDAIHMLHETQNSNLIKNKYPSWTEPRTQTHARAVKKFSRQRASQKHDTTTNTNKKSQAGQKHCWDNIKRSVRQFRVGRTWNVRHYQMSAPDRKYMQATCRCHAHFLRMCIWSKRRVFAGNVRVSLNRATRRINGEPTLAKAPQIWYVEDLLFFSGEKTHQFPQ